MIRNNLRKLSSARSGNLPNIGPKNSTPFPIRFPAKIIPLRQGV